MNSDSGRTNGCQSPQAASDANTLMDQLRGLLRQQVASARAGRLDSVSAAIPRIQVILEELPASNRSATDAETSQEIQRLHHELCLMVAAQKGELAREIKKMSLGKTSLRAYKSAHATGSLNSRRA